MPGISDWLSKLKQYGQNALQSYGDAQQQYQSLPNELQARQEMSGQSPAAPLAPLPEPIAPATLAPYEHVHPGYRPIGGQNALRRVYSGQGTTMKSESGPGF